jgi:hypothetical protein
MGCTIALFDIDKSGVSAAYLEPARLLGISCTGLLGVFFIKFFSSYNTIVKYILLLTLCTLLGFLLYNEVNIRSAAIAIWALSCLFSMIHPISITCINTQIETAEKPFFFSTCQIFSQGLNILAPKLANILLANFGFKSLLLFCILINILRILVWKQLDAIKVATKEERMQKYGMLTGFKEIVQNPGLLWMISFRIISHIGIVAYTISLPIIAAEIANGNSQIHAQLFSHNMSINNLAFIVSGIWGSWQLKRNPKLIIYFFNISPMLIVLAAIIAFYARQPLYLQITALFYGAGLYFFRTATSTIAQALTKKNKLAYAILAGDGTVKFFAYGISYLMPLWVVLPPIWGIAHPFVGCILCSLLSLRIAKPIVKMYLSSLGKENSVK